MKGSELYFGSEGTSAPKVSDCTAKAVSSGPSLSAKATFWPFSGTVARRFVLAGGQTAVS